MMRSLTEIIRDMNDVAKLARNRQAQQAGVSAPELLSMIEMLALDVQHLAKHVSELKEPVS